MGTDFYSEQSMQICENIVNDVVTSDIDYIRFYDKLYGTVCDKIAKRGIPLTKELIQSITAMLFEEQRKTAESITTAVQQFKLLTDEFSMTEVGDLRRLLRVLLTVGKETLPEYVLFLQDEKGYIRMDSEHLFLLCRGLEQRIMRGTLKLSSMSIEVIKKIALYFRLQELTGKKLNGTHLDCEGELDMIGKHIRRINGRYIAKVDGILPTYRKVNMITQWVACPYVMSNYFTHFAVPNDCDMYYFEPEFMTLAMVVRKLKGCDYAAALSFIKNETRGLFYKDIDHEMTDKMVREIAEGRFSNFDGCLARDYRRYLKEDIETSREGTITSVTNLYALDVVTRCEAMIGYFMCITNREMREYPNNEHDDIARVFFCNPRMFAIAVKKGTPIEKLLPVNYKYFKKADVGSLEKIIFNEI